jgi:hypothetical protein
MINSVTNRLCVLLVFTQLFCTGCATMQTSIPLNEAKKVTVMPLVDARKSQEFNVDSAIPDSYLYGIFRGKTTSTIVNNIAKRALLYQGYEVDFADKFSADKDYEPLQIAEMDATELSLLGPVNSKTLLFFFLNHIGTSNAIIYATADVDLTAIVVKKNPPKILWKYNLINSEGHAGLGSGFFIDDAIPGAVAKSFEEIISIMPDISQLN